VNASDIVNELLDDSLVGLPLLEDRISLLADKFNITIEKVQEIAALDPSRNKKFLPWLAARWAGQDQGFSAPQEITQALQQLERLVKLPAFSGSKDIQAYQSIEELISTVKAAEGLKSSKEKMLAGAKVVATAGNLKLVKIEGDNNFQTLIWYSTHNVLNPPAAQDQQGREESQTNWCVRFPDHAKNHISQGPFYIVLKDNKTYLAIHPSSGQVRNTDQQKFTFNGAQANEVAPLVSQEFLASADMKQFRGDMKHFISAMDLPDGAVIDDNLDYSKTKGRKIPTNLTVNGSLNLEGSDISEIPTGLKVKGDLNIKGTPIKWLSDCVIGSRLFRDDSFPLSEVYMLVWRVKLPQMKENFIVTRSTKGYKNRETGQLMPPTSREEAEAAWPKMQDELQRYYASLANVDQIQDPDRKKKIQDFAQRAINEIS